LFNELRYNPLGNADIAGLIDTSFAQLFNNASFKRAAVIKVALNG
jgi:hypothetical protein